MSDKKQTCQYKDPENTDHSSFYCTEAATSSGYCFWHDKTIDKSTPDIKGKLELHAKNGGMLRGIQLSQSQLEGIDLVNHGKKEGYDFSYADFYHANLKNGHLFNINLTNASLMKADLRDSNLNCANLEKTNMLGVKWSGSKFENVKIGTKLKQEFDAKTAQINKDIPSSIDYLEQAEEIYRDLRKHAEREGIFSLSGFFIQKELTMRRLQLPRYSMARFLSKIVDIFCGYGEAPLRIIGLSIIIIILCAIMYSFTGLNYQDTIQTISSEQSLQQNIHFFLSSLYYSVVTFTTLGYGDFTPVGLSRAIAAIEAFTGSFTIALFVVVFVKKMTR
ncbi:ion channel [Colwellia sp. RSH04]|uniref:ion channel n=1 Tax=Colwellia sp. RSH04 TaxID=2305464 RepID=UPI000E571A0D|nr:ion channel [Colwellia sp. RSH04]RHW75311.1 pentapeptide repeat-containing protein [Colwellia sp. RSH04]